MENVPAPPAMSSTDDYRASGILVGRKGGPVDLVDTLAWYDGPIVFLSRDAEGARFLSIIVDDDREKRTTDYVLIAVDDEEAAALSAAKELGPHNRIGEAAIRRGGGADFFRTSWDKGWTVLEQRRLGVDEALEEAIVTDDESTADGPPAAGQGEQA